MLFSSKVLSQSTNYEGDTNLDQINKNCGLAHPDSKTKTEVFQTENEADNEILFSQFKSDLGKETFIINKSELSENYTNSYYNFKKNIRIEIKGSGIRQYYIKRKIAKPKYYYPYFILTVYEFKNEKDAKLVLNKIKAALNSKGRFPNGKSPTTVTINKTEILELSTGPEMFREYINSFEKKLKNYH